jgi:hypothetical protein
MIQLKNYTGEGTYVVVSLLNPKGAYKKTCMCRKLIASDIVKSLHGGSFTVSIVPI